MSAHTCTKPVPGTYGMPCGKPATLAQSSPSVYWAGGVYWSHLCEECAGDGAVALDPETHRNVHIDNAGGAS